MQRRPGIILRREDQHLRRLALVAQPRTELFGDVRKPPCGLGRAGERDVAAAGAERAEHEAGVVVAVDDELVADLAAERVQEADAGVTGGARGAAQAHGHAELGRNRQDGAGLVEVVDDDLGRFYRLPSAATPGSSLPSSHSRNAPPAVET